MKKSYQLAGYTLHVIPSKKFKNITMSLKLEGKLTKENVTKRSLLAFMLTGGTAVSYTHLIFITTAVSNWIQ